MSKIVIFSGTTEGRMLSEKLSKKEIVHTVCVATEFGEMVMDENPYASVRMGRMTQEEMCAFFKEEAASLIVDATHPYASVVTENIALAAQSLNLEYLRVLRTASDPYDEMDGNGIHTFSDIQSCAEALRNVEGKILLTTGSKEVGAFLRDEGLLDRIYARVLPSEESIRLCREAGLDGRQIIAMFGPFTYEMNSLIMKEKEIAHLVTKVSGRTGGFDEKIKAAKDLGIEIWMITPPVQSEGASVEDAFAMISSRADLLEEVNKTANDHKPLLHVSLAGIGMGSEESMTIGVRNRIESADVILGASRMVKPYEDRKLVEPIYLSRDILPYLEKMMEKGHDVNAVILFSGDSGMYSGTKKLLDGLKQMKERLTWIAMEIEILPGISSVSFFASRIGVPYSDTAVESLHGRTKDLAYHRTLAKRLKQYKDSFILLSGPEDLKIIQACFTKKEQESCFLTLGYQLGYPQEKITRHRMDNLPEGLEKGLYICHIRNDAAVIKEALAFPAIPDEAFIRDKVPMTKADVRHLSVLKLGLNEHSILYDVGSGTGSVSIEAASIADSIKVYAFEKKKEAVSLMRSNLERFGLDNVTLIEGNAPSSFEGIQNPTHVFIGGSGGNLKEILQTLLNNRVDCCCRFAPLRVVINAISLETVTEITQLISEFDVSDEEIICAQISRSKKAGHYHLMEAQNPVYIASFTIV